MTVSPPDIFGGSPSAADPAICSRAVRVDPESGMAIWELRDPMTGRVLKQYPSARSVAAYRSRLVVKEP